MPTSGAPSLQSCNQMNDLYMGVDHRIRTSRQDRAHYKVTAPCTVSLSLPSISRASSKRRKVGGTNQTGSRLRLSLCAVGRASAINDLPLWNLAPNYLLAMRVRPPFPTDSPYLRGSALPSRCGPLADMVSLSEKEVERAFRASSLVPGSTEANRLSQKLAQLRTEKDAAESPSDLSH